MAITQRISPVIFVVILTIFFLFTGVSAQKSRLFKTGLPQIPKADPVLLYSQLDDDFPDSVATKVGILYSKDFEPSESCTFFKIINILKQHARDNGANVLKITEHKGPGFSTTCERITVEIYRIDSVGKYENVILWQKDRKLTWKDFKGVPKSFSNNNVAAQASCGFNFLAQRVYTTNKFQAFCPNVFVCKQSWVAPDSIGNIGALNFQQLCFDLGEVFARKLRMTYDLLDMTITRTTEDGASMYSKFAGAYANELEKMMSDTEYGRIPGKVETWRNRVDMELSALEDFSYE